MTEASAPASFRSIQERTQDPEYMIIFDSARASLDNPSGAMDSTIPTKRSYVNQRYDQFLSQQRERLSKPGDMALAELNLADGILLGGGGLHDRAQRHLKKVAGPLRSSDAHPEEKQSYLMDKSTLNDEFQLLLEAARRHMKTTSDLGGFNHTIYGCSPRVLESIVSSLVYRGSADETYFFFPIQKLSNGDLVFPTSFGNSREVILVLLRGSGADTVVEISGLNTPTASRVRESDPDFITLAKDWSHWRK